MTVSLEKVVSGMGRMLVLEVWTQDTLEQGLENCGLWAKASLPSNFVKKVLLDHSYSHPFMYHLWLLLGYNSRVE